MVLRTEDISDVRVDKLIIFFIRFVDSFQLESYDGSRPQPAQGPGGKNGSIAWILF